MTDPTPSHDGELIMNVICECMELAQVKDAEKVEQAIWDFAAHIKKVWIENGTPLYVVIPALAFVFGLICNEWYGVPMEGNEGLKTSGKETETNMKALIDRIEGDSAVLLFGEKELKVDIPRELLPIAAMEDSWLNVNFELDAEEMKKLEERIRKLLDMLKKRGKG